MKPLILTVIVLVIPTFFVFVFVMSTVSKLTGLRKRCREIRERIGATAAMSPIAANSLPVQEVDPLRQREFHVAAEQYNAARRRFPSNLLAALCGFHELEPLPGQPADGGGEGP